MWMGQKEQWLVFWGALAKAFYFDRTLEKQAHMSLFVYFSPKVYEGEGKF